jgi:hypothetical protein
MATGSSANLSFATQFTPSMTYGDAEMLIKLLSRLPIYCDGFGKLQATCGVLSRGGTKWPWHKQQKKQTFYISCFEEFHTILMSNLAAWSYSALAAVAQ